MSCGQVYKGESPCFSFVQRQGGQRFPLDQLGFLLGLLPCEQYFTVLYGLLRYDFVSPQLFSYALLALRHLPLLGGQILVWHCELYPRVILLPDCDQLTRDLLGGEFV